MNRAQRRMVDKGLRPQIKAIRKEAMKDLNEQENARKELLRARIQERLSKFADENGNINDSDLPEILRGIFK